MVTDFDPGTIPLPPSDVVKALGRAILTDKEIKYIVLVHSLQHRGKCGSRVGRSPVYSRSRQSYECRGKSNTKVLGGKNRIFRGFFLVIL
jgi:hypothetical protein